MTAYSVQSQLLRWNMPGRMKTRIKVTINQSKLGFSPPKSEIIQFALKLWKFALWQMEASAGAESALKHYQI